MKSNNLYNNSLYTFFCSNNSSNILFSLKEFDGIDVLYQNGFFFSCAISKGNVEICKALITYFEDKQFPVKDRKYEEAKEKLIEILGNATDNVVLSPEMKKVLSPYIDFEGSEHDTLNDSFSDVDQTIFVENFNKDTASDNLLNEEVLRRFNAETKKISQKQIIEDVLGFNSHDISKNYEDSSGELQLALVGKLNETEAH
jgi:hypothetical protein